MEAVSQPEIVAALSDEQLVARFRSLKDVNNGHLEEPDAAAAVEKEMARRGLVPDREDLIPDQSAPDPDLEDATGDADDIPPGPISAAGDRPEEEIPG